MRFSRFCGFIAPVGFALYIVTTASFAMAYTQTAESTSYASGSSIADEHYISQNNHAYDTMPPASSDEHHDSSSAAVEGSEEHSSGGLPQLDPKSYPGQAFWLFMCFGLLYLMMSRVALPKVAEVVENRESIISGNIALAEKLRDETENTKKAYEAALLKAEKDATDVVNQAVHETNMNCARKIEETTDSINKSLENARLAIIEEKKIALAEADDMIHDFAADIIKTILGEGNAFPAPTRKKA